MHILYIPMIQAKNTIHRTSTNDIWAKHQNLSEWINHTPIPNSCTWFKDPSKTPFSGPNPHGRNRISSASRKPPLRRQLYFCWWVSPGALPVASGEKFSERFPAHNRLIADKAVAMGSLFIHSSWEPARKVQLQYARWYRYMRFAQAQRNYERSIISSPPTHTNPPKQHTNQESNQLSTQTTGPTSWSTNKCNEYIVTTLWVHWSRINW